MNQKQHSRAFSLVELTVGLVVGGVALYGGLRAFSFFQKANVQATATANAKTQVVNVGSFLKSRFEGSKNFQNLAIRFPAASGSFTTPRTSIGPGYAVYTNSGYNGADLPGACQGRFDNINVVVGAPTPKAAKITVAPSGVNLQIGPVSGTASVADQFKPGELMILSSVNASEALYVSPAGLPLVNVLTDLVVDAYTGKSLINATASGSKFINTFVAGDYVFRAIPYQIGVQYTSTEPCVGKLVFGNRPFTYMSGGGAQPQVVSEGVTRFKVIPILEQDLKDCAALTPPQGEKITETNAVWDTINADSTGKCYSALKAIKISYTINVFSNVERGVANQVSSAADKAKTTEVSGEYVFQSNK